MGRKQKDKIFSERDINLMTGEISNSEVMWTAMNNCGNFTEVYEISCRKDHALSPGP